MKTIATAVCLAVSNGSQILTEPGPRELLQAQSIHVLGFTAADDLLLAESDGRFSVAEWDEVVEKAREICCQPGPAASLDDAMVTDSHTPTNMRYFIRSVMASKMAEETRWSHAQTA